MLKYITTEKASNVGGPEWAKAETHTHVPYSVTNAIDIPSSLKYKVLVQKWAHSEAWQHFKHKSSTPPI